MSPRYYGIDGQPISEQAWARMHDSQQRIVGSTTVAFNPEVWVSTVWLGLDHGYGDGPPIIFETMVFGGEDDQFQDRYYTLEAAKRGHLAVVKALLAGQPLEERD